MRLTLPPDIYIRGLFGAQTARDGGIVRRPVREVERVVGRRPFVVEMRRRGFTVLEQAGQFVVFCNQEPVREVI